MNDVCSLWRASTLCQGFVSLQEQLRRSCMMTDFCLSCNYWLLHFGFQNLERRKTLSSWIQFDWQMNPEFLDQQESSAQEAFHQSFIHHKICHSHRLHQLQSVRCCSFYLLCMSVKYQAKSFYWLIWQMLRWKINIHHSSDWNVVCLLLIQELQGPNCSLAPITFSIFKYWWQWWQYFGISQMM